MLVNESESVMAERNVQFENACSPIEVNAFGHVKEVRPLFEKANLPILVTVFGSVMEVRS